MNRKQKITLLIGITIIVLAFIVWLYYGGQLFTKTQVLIEKKDELFGTTYKEWKNQFIWGLDYTLYVSGATVLVCGILFFVFRKKRKLNETSN
jgi:hypothetical protein